MSIAKVFPLRGDSATLRDMTKAAEEATRVLEEHWWPYEGEDSIPIDPALIARRVGLRVLRAPLQADFAGSLRKGVNEDPVILLNERDSIARQKFTCAHELGHYFQRVSSDDSESMEYVDFRDSLASAGTDDAEIFANSFAASLLMPKSLVSGAYGEGDPLWLLAKRFGVSPDAMRYRLKNLKLSLPAL
jgi:Zn-dependent peptidase ImmA (M78 family)